MSPTAKIIDGRVLASQIQEEVRQQINKLNLRPGLAVILVGKDPASRLYVKLKAKAAQKSGILFCLYKFESAAPEKEIMEAISWLNQDEEINGILVQLPLPADLDENKIVNAIRPDKDVDGFHPGNTNIIPGLNLGIMRLLKATGENLQGKNALIIARSPEFTGALAHILQEFSVKAEVISPDSEEAKIKSREADIIIAAAGQPNWLRASDIKEGSIVIDVGTNYLNEEIAVGDVDFAGVSAKAGWITPVPGGVGPMTVAMLLKNTVALNLINRKKFA